MRYRVGILLVAGLFLFFGNAGGAAAEPGGLAIELNKVETTPSGCRLHFHAHNATAVKISVLSADLVFFGPDGVMTARSLVSFGLLHPDKRRFYSWEFPGADCGEVSRILVNGLEQCRHDGGESFDCLAALSTSHKGPIELVK